MIMKRRMSHYMITYYLPSSLFVVVSWTSFLIPSDDIQGRMALLVTLFLVLVSLIFLALALKSMCITSQKIQSSILTVTWILFGFFPEGVELYQNTN